MSVEMEILQEAISDVEAKLEASLAEIRAAEQRILDLRHEVSLLETKRDVLLGLKSAIEAKGAARAEDEPATAPVPASVAASADSAIGVIGWDPPSGGSRAGLDMVALADTLSRLVKTELPRDEHGRCTLTADDVEGFALKLLDKVEALPGSRGGEGPQGGARR